MQNSRILIVDDDLLTMLPLRDALQTLHGYHVTLTAEKTLVTKLSAERYALLFVDLMIHKESFDIANNRLIENIQFPNVNWKRTGLEFIKQIRGGAFMVPSRVGTRPDVPIIVLSAAADKTTLDELRLYCLDSSTVYMEKPYLLADIVQCISQLLSGA